MARTTSRKELVYENNEWKYRKITETSVPDYRGILTVDKSKTQVTYEPLESEGLVKSLEFDIVITRTALNPRTNLNVDAFFSQEVKASIPKEKARKHHFLSMVSQLVFLHDLLHGLTIHVCLFGESEFRHPDIEFERIGKPKKITREQASKLLKEPTTFKYCLPENEGRFGYVNLANY